MIEITKDFVEGLLELGGRFLIAVVLPEPLSPMIPITLLISFFLHIAFD